MAHALLMACRLPLSQAKLLVSPKDWPCDDDVDSCAGADEANPKPVDGLSRSDLAGESIGVLRT